MHTQRLVVANGTADRWPRRRKIGKLGTRRMETIYIDRLWELA